jgi:hypothetical protein
VPIHIGFAEGMLTQAGRSLTQLRKGKNKLYALHAPEVK